MNLMPPFAARYLLCILPTIDSLSTQSSSMKWFKSMQPKPPAGQKTRVLHILGGLNPSGMERMLVSGAPYFSEHHCETIVLGQGMDHPYRGDLVAAGYDVRIHEESLRSLRGQKALRRLLVSERIDVVHIHTESNYLVTALSAALGMRGEGVIVRTIHNAFNPPGFRFFTRLVQALIADRIVDHLLAPSDDVAQNERRFFRSPKVVYNWVDDRFFGLALQRRDSPNNSQNALPVALIVGNCSSVKRHELAERAVLNAGHNLMHIGSETNAKEEERLLLSTFDDRERLLLRGAQAPDAALLAADYFLMSSTNEGMGVALAEAMVVGLPCFIADVPGLRWAAAFPGVTVLSESQEDWNRQISSFVPRSPDAFDNPDGFDFSAQRGVAEYVSMYAKS